MSILLAIIEYAIAMNRTQQESKQQRASPDEPTKWILHDDFVLDEVVIIRRDLEAGKEAEVIDLLTKNNDIFAWSSMGLNGINRDIIKHKLDFENKIKPMR